MKTHIRKAFVALVLFLCMDVAVAKEFPSYYPTMRQSGFMQGQKHPEKGGLVVAGLDLAQFEYTRITYFILVQPNLLVVSGVKKSGDPAVSTINLLNKKEHILCVYGTDDFKGLRKILGLGGVADTEGRLPTIAYVIVHYDIASMISEDTTTYIDIFNVDQSEGNPLLNREVLDRIDTFAPKPPRLGYRFLNNDGDKPGVKQVSKIFLSETDEGPMLILWQRLYSSRKLDDPEKVEDFEFPKQSLKSLLWNSDKKKFLPCEKTPQIEELLDNDLLWHALTP